MPLPQPSNMNPVRRHYGPPPMRRQVLIVSEGIEQVRDLPRSGMVRIGRGSRVGVRIADDSVSRIHAALHIGDRMFIEDLDSFNGTFVRGIRLTARHPQEVFPGDQIEVGKVSIVLLPQR